MLLVGKSLRAAYQPLTPALPHMFGMLAQGLNAPGGPAEHVAVHLPVCRVDVEALQDVCGDGALVVAHGTHRPTQTN